jgi:hypothetical protein
VLIPEVTSEANESIKQDPLGGYCYFAYYERGKLEVCLDGDFDIDDVRRILHYMEVIHEDLLK